MPQVKVTIEDSVGTRNYSGDYVYAFIAKKAASESVRFLQTPQGWERDSGLFHAAVTALLNIAESGDTSRIQKASIEMLKVFKKYSPDGDSAAVESKVNTVSGGGNDNVEQE